MDRTLPCRVANSVKEQVYAVKHLATGKLPEVPVVKMQFYADHELEITGELCKLFQQWQKQGENHIRSTSAIRRAANGDEFAVKAA